MSRARRFAPSLWLLLAACGGGGGAGGAGGEGPKGPSDSIGELAARQGGVGALGGSGGGSAGVAPGALRAESVDKDNPVKLDGVAGEWGHRAAAKGGATSFQCALQYDGQHLYVMGDVGKPSLAGGDHASLVLAFPQPGGTFATYEIALTPGKPGESVGNVRIGKGDVVGAKIVEAPRDGGLTFEASVPWSAMPAAQTVRVGLRGACRFHDGETIVSTGPGDARTPKELAPIPTSPELALMEGILAEKGLAQSTPRFDIVADVAGDGAKERVTVWGDRILTVVGHGYRGGKEYFFRDVGAEIVDLSARDVTGRGKEDLLLRRKFTTRGEREWFEIWSFGKGDEPEPIFSHEVSVAMEGKRVTNAVRIAQREIDVSWDKAEGWDAATYREPTASDTEPVLLPWGAVKSRSYRWDGSKFVKGKEVPQAPDPRAAGVPSEGSIKLDTPPTPPVKKNTDLSKQVFEAYRRDRKVAADLKPTTDLEVNLDGDARPERAVLIGRDLVVFGPGFKGGTTYAFVTLSQFAAPEDVKELSARDLTGDGAAELVVRGTRRVKTEGQGEVEMDTLFVYQLQGERLARVFGIETARAQGGKRVQGMVQFIPAKGGKGFEIDVRPGRAVGWTEKTYPWPEEQPGSGPVEPLLLPWGKVGSLRYAWSGTAFTKQ